jgi:hypothetical protein
MLRELDYLSRPEVLKEMSDFLAGRWVAVHCSRKMKDGRPLLIRYWNAKPLKASNPAELLSLVNRLKHLQPRAFYGTANIYHRLESREDALNYEENVSKRTVTWDIDSTPEYWKATIEVARIIVDFLEKWGVARSIWLKWSGRGMHVHIHENAVSSSILERHGVLDTTWSLAQFVLENVKEKVAQVNVKHGSKIKVENLMDPQRVFTAPLSLHRTLDAVCIALKPEDLDSFSLEWISPINPVHNKNWRVYQAGEADNLAEEAVRRIGGYLRKSKQQVAAGAITAPLVLENPAELPVGVKLRFNEFPGKLRGRKLSLDPMKAVRLLEDVLSCYVLGKISREEAVSFLDATRKVTLRAQGYSQKDVEVLEKLYEQAIYWLENYTREEVEKLLKES